MVYQLISGAVEAAYHGRASQRSQKQFWMRVGLVDFAVLLLTDLDVRRDRIVQGTSIGLGDRCVGVGSEDNPWTLEVRRCISPWIAVRVARG